MSYREVIIQVFKEVIKDDFRDGAKKDEFPFWDSLHHVKLMQRLESELGLKFTAIEALSVRDTDGLVRLIEAKHKK